MKFIQKTDRFQAVIFPKTLEELVGDNNFVRVIDLYVDSLNLKELGFKTEFSENGRPRYHPADLLKLYIYGYMNKIRSSRDLEKECIRNVEVMWLIGNLVPDHNTISNFRRDNPRGIEKAFRNTVEVAQNFDLIGGALIAGDSSRFRAQNSKKNNFTKGKIEEHIKYLDRKVKEYNDLLDNADNNNEVTKEIEEKIKDCEVRKDKYQEMQSDMEQSGETQISLSDPESRLLIGSTNQAEVGYNVQISVDAKHFMILDYKVTSDNDKKAMGCMARRLKAILAHGTFTALYDKGYHTGSEFAYVEKLGINVLVASPQASSHAPDPAYDVSQFTYDKETDEYICPVGKSLTTNGKIHKKVKNKVSHEIKRYRTTACKTCPFLASCTKRKDGKAIERSEYMDQIDANRIKLEANKDLYKRRQEIVEHPFGTIKRQWGFDHIMTKKTKKRAGADIGLIMISYNLRRLINILGLDKIKAYLMGQIVINSGSVSKSV